MPQQVQQFCVSEGNANSWDLSPTIKKFLALHETLLSIQGLHEAQANQTVGRLTL
jgi:hypothetical protein